MNPLVSIIIPTYNRAHLIGETLDSILAQTYTNWECIVVDDGSTDSTDSLLAEYCTKDNRFQYHHRPKDRPKGANSCRNYGFELSKGEYINWFDSDDLLVKHAFWHFIENFNSLNDEVVISKVLKFNNKNEILSESTILSNNLIEDYLSGKVKYYPSGIVWKRRFLDKQKKLFDESISNLDDWDFNLRMFYQEPSLKYINEPLIYYRVHENSLSHEIGKLNFNEILSEINAREKHYNLLYLNKKANPLNVKKEIKDRYFYFFRETMVAQHGKRFYFFKKLIKTQIELYDGFGVFKTLFGFVIYEVFKKGYRFLQ